MPAQERDDDAAMRAATDAREKLRLHGLAIGAIQQRLGPILLALRGPRRRSRLRSGLGRGSSADDFARWLTDAWTRLLLR